MPTAVAHDLETELRRAEARLNPLAADLAHLNLVARRLREIAAPDAATLVELDHVESKRRQTAADAVPVERRVAELKSLIAQTKRDHQLAQARARLAGLDTAAKDATASLEAAFAALHTYFQLTSDVIGLFRADEQVAVYRASNPQALAAYMKRALADSGLTVAPDRGDGLTPAQCTERVAAWLATQ